MKSPKHIQITIPEPCHEDWNRMTVTDQGRFCANCQKCVVDLTAYSDAQLYEFLTKNKDKKVCGRMYDNQLNRHISLPAQPCTKLYNLYIGFSLFVVFTGLPSNDARAFSPVISEYVFPADSNINKGNPKVA